MLDETCCNGIIANTYRAHSEGSAYVAQKSRQFQDRCPEAFWLSSFKSADCQRRAIQIGRLLRPPRSSTDKVRNAATCKTRQTDGQTRGIKFWFFPAFILSGIKSVRERWATWLDPEKNGASSSAQIGRRCDGLCCSGIVSQRNAQVFGFDSAHRREIWNISSFPQCGESTCAAEKKTHSGRIVSSSATCTGRFTEQYEKLRSYVLEGTFSNNRHGLDLFVKEGFASWVSKLSVNPEPTKIEKPIRREKGVGLEYLQDEIVNILMEMTLGSLEEVMS